MLQRWAEDDENELNEVFRTDLEIRDTDLGSWTIGENKEDRFGSNCKKTD